MGGMYGVGTKEIQARSREGYRRRVDSSWMGRGRRVLWPAGWMMVGREGRGNQRAACTRGGRVAWAAGMVRPLKLAVESFRVCPSKALSSRRPFFWLQAHPNPHDPAPTQRTPRRRFLGRRSFAYTPAHPGCQAAASYAQRSLPSCFSPVMSGVATLETRLYKHAMGMPNRVRSMLQRSSLSRYRLA